MSIKMPEGVSGGLSRGARKYLEECLDSMWNQDTEYLETEAKVRRSWDKQNEIRAANGVKPLSTEDLRNGLEDKGPKPRGSKE